VCVGGEKNLCALEIFVYYLSRDSLSHGGRVECHTHLTRLLPNPDNRDEGVEKPVGIWISAKLNFPIAMSFSIRYSPDTLLLFLSSYRQLFLPIVCFQNVSCYSDNPEIVQTEYLVNPRDDPARNASSIFLPILAILEMTLMIIASFPVN
jgi:hypothetical protein